MTRDWNLNTTPMRALNRRKLLDIVVMLKLGRCAKAVALSSGAIGVSVPASSSAGMTCCRSLDHDGKLT